MHNCSRTLSLGVTSILILGLLSYAPMDVPKANSQLYIDNSNSDYTDTTKIQDSDVCTSSEQTNESSKSANELLVGAKDALKRGEKAWKEYAQAKFGSLPKSLAAGLEKGLKELAGRVIDNETKNNSLQASNIITYFTKIRDDIGISYEYPCGWSESGTGSRSFNDMAVNLDEILSKFKRSDISLIDAGLASKVHEQIIKEDNEFGYKIIEPLNMETYVIDGEKAGTLLYSLHTEWRKDVITVHNGVQHIFTYYTLKSLYEEDLPAMNHIINSIKWLD